MKRREGRKGQDRWREGGKEKKGRKVRKLVKERERITRYRQTL